MTLLPRHPRHYVVFTRNPAVDGVMPWWWRVWVRHLYRGPTHVFAMRWCGGGWVAFEASPSAITYGYLEGHPDLPVDLAARGHRVVSVERAVPTRFAIRGLLSCVSATKMLLGVRRWCVITPQQLLMALLADGHEEVVFHGCSPEAPEALTD